MDAGTENIIDKVRALLLLAEKNTNKAEMESALLKAQELMARYSISEAQIHAKKTEVRTFKSAINGSGFRWIHNLMGVIEDNFKVRAFFRGSEVAFMGMNDDADLAGVAFTFAYEYARDHAEQEYRKAYQRWGSGSGVRNSYLTGFVLGLNDKFVEQRRRLEQESESLALVLVRDKRVDESAEDLLRDKKAAACRGNQQATSERYVLRGYADGHLMPDYNRVLED